MARPPRTRFAAPFVVVVTAASFVIGYLLHVFVEKPSLRIRDRLAA